MRRLRERAASRMSRGKSRKLSSNHAGMSIASRLTSWAPAGSARTSDSATEASILISARNPPPLPLHISSDEAYCNTCGRDPTSPLPASGREDFVHALPDERADGYG